jgi:hypothetical protein
MQKLSVILLFAGAFSFQRAKRVMFAADEYELPGVKVVPPPPEAWLFQLVKEWPERVKVFEGIVALFPKVNEIVLIEPVPPFALKVMV